MMPTLVEIKALPDIITQDRFVVRVRDTKLLCAVACTLRDRQLHVRMMMSHDHDVDQKLLRDAYTITLEMYKTTGEPLTTFTFFVQDFNVVDLSLDADASGCRARDAAMVTYGWHVTGIALDA